jgi:hypothetical protein
MPSEAKHEVERASLPPFIPQCPKEFESQAPGKEGTITAGVPFGMHSIVQFLVKNGYRVLLAAVFANQVGLPGTGNFGIRRAMATKRPAACMWAVELPVCG